MLMEPPFYVLHYKKNLSRMHHIREATRGRVRPIIIDQLDAGEFQLNHYYQFDYKEYADQVYHIRDVLIAGTLQSSKWKDTSWAEKIKYALQADLGQAALFEHHPWLTPYELSDKDVSNILKHFISWTLIATGKADLAIVAEDDVLIRKDSFDYLNKIIQNLPEDADFVDIAGGVGLHASKGHAKVGDYFYKVDPPRDRTTCCYIISKRFARRLIAEEISIAMAIDWLATYLFRKLNANVYWVEPLVFEHGSEVGVYSSHRHQTT